VLPLRASARRGLGEAGYVEGRNVAIEYRYADNQPNRLRTLATDLIARQVAAIAATGGNPPALAAKALTSTIPIVFTSGCDPVAAGLVSSLSRPEANLTGVSWFGTELGPKHIEQRPDKVPRIGVLTPAQSDATPILDALRKGLADFGYMDGKTIRLDFRFAKGNTDALRAHAAELAQIPVDVIVIDGSSATRVAWMRRGRSRSSSGRPATRCSWGS
jgi:ABC transporter substrate binding protein